MVNFISLLRGINVSGKKLIKMADLRAMYEAVALENVRSYVQSGNVLFQSDATVSELESKLHQAIEDTFGFDVKVFVYSIDDWKAIVARNPYAKDTSKDRKYLYFTFLSEVSQVTEFDNLPLNGEEYVIDGRVIYTYYGNGYGRSKLNNNFWERKLKVSATTRNWNTVHKLLDLAT